MEVLMKKFLVFLLFSGLVLMISCGGETAKDTEELSDIPDWDYSNVVTDDEAGDTDAPIDSGDTDVTDTSADTGDTYPGGDSGTPEETPDAETEPVQICGNETVEYGERCDSIVATTCSNLNPNLSGAAKCREDCTAFDMSKCDKKIWGALNVRFSTKFIMDNAKIGDPSYFAQGALPYAAFNGLYGDSKQYFPKNGEAASSFAVTDNYTGTFGANKRQLFVKQSPASGYPRHELEFAPGTIKSGAEYKVNAVSLFDMVDNLLKLVRYRLVDRQNGTECIMGIGYSGSVNVTSVYPENADLYEGGSIEISANNVDFYYPTEIPGIDEETAVPEEVLKYPLCSK